MREGQYKKGGANIIIIHIYCIWSLIKDESVTIHSIYNAYVSFYPTFTVFCLSLCSNRWFFFNNHRLFNENASLNLEIIVHIIFGRYGQLENYFHNWNRIVSELSIVHTVYLIISVVAKIVPEQYLKNCPAHIFMYFIILKWSFSLHNHKVYR